MSTCGDTPMLVFGGMNTTELAAQGLNHTARLRKIKTVDSDSWDVYLQETLFNDAAIWADDGGR